MSSIPNRDVRAQASDVVKTYLGRLIMLTLAAVGAPLLLVYISIFIGAGPLMGVDLDRLSASASADVFSAIGSLLALLVLCVAVSSMLQVGYTRGLQLLASGVKVKGGVLISRSKHTLGCVGLQMWIGLKTMAWYIPGMLIQSLGTLLLTSGEIGGRLVGIVGSIVTLCLVIPAYYRYALAIHVFAESPEIGVYDAVARSKALMANRKWQLFCLTAPYALLAIGVMCAMVGISFLVQQIDLGVFGAWLLSMVTFGAVAALCYLMLEANVATACYYNAHKE